MGTSKGTTIRFTTNGTDLRRSLRLLRRGGCLLIFVFLCVFIALPLSATTYYVSNAGSDSNNGTTSGTPWQTVAKVNSSSFSPGDSILFNRGDIWHELLTMPSLGSVGSPITLGAYGTGVAPIISGASLVTGWILKGNNVWQATLTTKPNLLLFNTTLGVLATSEANITAPNEWFWAANVLSLYSVGNPASTYISPGIQAAQRFQGIQLGSKSYITVQDLIVEASNGSNVDLTEGGGSNITIRNCEIRYSGSTGVQLGRSASGGDINITGNLIHDNAFDAVNIYINVGSTAGHESYIQNNTMYNNGGHGVEIRGNHFIVQYNLIHDNGAAMAGHGIHTFALNNSEGTGNYNTIQYNVIYNQSATSMGDGQGIELDQWTTGNNIFYNVLYKNQGAGITLYDASSVNVYGNSLYGNETGDVGTNCRADFMLVSSISNLITNVVVKNNIAYAITANVPAICVDGGTAANTLTISHNDWYASATNWWSWAGTLGSNLTTWNAHTGVSGDLNGDPLYSNASVGNLTLTTGSPAIDAGMNLGSTYQTALFSSSVWPGYVATGNQNSYGTGWEIGAFIFANSSVPNAPSGLSTQVQ